ncbi:TPA: glycosyltransferase family 4 protein [Enterobacter kobei]
MKERDPKLYIDCTSTFRSGLNTGVQRVVRALIGEAKTFSEITQLDCIPICYQFNGFYTLEDAQKITLDTLSDFVALEFNFRDIYLCPDAFWSYGMTSWYDYFRDHGVSIATVVYDLIPIVNPEFSDPTARHEFESALVDVVRKSDLLFTISQSTRKDLIEYCSSKGEIFDSERCQVIPLAPALQAARSDIDSERLPDGLFFLMVGTVEPRRGYIEAISEYQTYLASGGNSSLLIIGKEGGASEEVTEFISHAGNKVIWLTDASDAELMAAYQHAVAVICPSKSEGYGMSVSEGLAYNGLVLANRLPVFGEFAGSSPYYFEIERSGDLARLLTDTPHLKRQDKLSDMGTWKNTATVLASELVSISKSHGRHKAIELRKNSEEAIRWAYWLLFDRKCSPEETSNWLKFENIQDMFEALRFESRNLTSPVSKEAIRWIQLIINGRDSVDNQEMEYWLEFGKIQDMIEAVKYENMNLTSTLSKDAIRWIQLIINERDSVDDEEISYWRSQSKSISGLRHKILEEHFRPEAPLSKLFVRWAFVAYLGELDPKPDELNAWFESAGTNGEFLTKLKLTKSNIQ